MLDCFKYYKRYIHISNLLLGLAWPKSMKLKPKQQDMLAFLHGQSRAYLLSRQSISR